MNDIEALRRSAQEWQDALEAERRKSAALRHALEDMRKQLREHVKFDVRKHYSLMVADAAAGTLLATEGR